ncbi:MAG: glycerate kinase [Candidatus Pseudobacter hemicellulosilyticus]|uniref:Glycerate kinase n=1 Tax=Candidatus Pseudobacter hemicellulosilyticus TaxID=3121375 RepID=A0AAJ6BIV7_9BACT|nr:MAG: glycerate kinase [Pseudobacter sp.]
MMHILVAPNAFKNSLPATAAADAICEGLLQSQCSCTCQPFPIGDGGDGTGDLPVQHLRATQLTATVQGPLGSPVQAAFGWLADTRTAIIEMAHASGLRLLHPSGLDPLRASSYGTGQLIRQALDLGARQILLCIGGSATVDGATGLLRALGVQFLDQQGQPLPDEPVALLQLASIDITNINNRIAACQFTILCDVDNPLLGPSGAAAVFGPQKGATPEMVQVLEAALGRLATVVQQQTGKDMTQWRHGGAAGGTAAGLAALLQASLVNGTDQFLDRTGFNEVLAAAQLVITGEGSIDVQTLQGKAPFGVARRAKDRGIPLVGLAGKLPLERDLTLEAWFPVLLPIGHEPQPLSEALPNTRENLVRTARSLGNLLAANGKQLP